MGLKFDGLSKVICFISVLLASPINALFSQNTGACPIRTNQNLELLESYKIPNSVSQEENLGVSIWEEGQNSYAEDNVFANNTVVPWNRTYKLRLQDFGFKIPEASYITGIRLIMKGYSEGEGKASDLFIHLLDDNGQEKGTNKANRNFHGFRWPHKDSTDVYEWNYGYNDDLWETDWTPQEINSSNFGVSIQLVNLTPSEISLFLDQVVLQVYYTEQVIQCSDICIPYFVIDDQATDFIWSLPDGFDHHPDVGGSKNILNMFPTTADFGTYEVCVTTVYSNNISDPCCLRFEYSPCITGSIGDFVYEDLNGNGEHDPFEPPLAGIDLELSGGNLDRLAVTTSDDFGQYLFDDLYAGEYYVGVYVPEGYSLSDQATIANGFIQDASDAIFLDYGEFNGAYDFGFFKTARIMGTVWNDNDGNGIRGDMEDLESMAVYLFDQQDDLVAQTMSNLEGVYMFKDLTPGVYYVAFEGLGDDYQATLQDVGNDDKIDSDIFFQDSIFRTEDLQILSGDDLFDVDAGFVFKSGNLAGRIWNDANGNGFIDSLEMAIPDMLVELYDCNDSLIQSTMTDSNGYYEFNDLPASISYYINISIAADFTSNGPLNENAIKPDGSSECILINPSSSFTLNGAIVPYSSVGDFVWLDENRNGLQDSTESGLSNYILILKDLSNNTIDSTVSDDFGFYTFEDILPGTYYVELDSLNGALELASINSSDNNSNSDWIDDNGILRSVEFILEGGNQLTNIDLGIVYQLGSINGYVWRDPNGDGDIQTDELPLGGIEVNLYDCQSNLIDQTFSLTDGTFLFEDVEPNQDYYLGFMELDGYQFSFDPGDTNVTNNNGIGTTDCITVLPASNVSLNSGYAPLGSIGDFVWLDVNGDGIQDGSEPGIEGIEVIMRDVFRNHIDTTVTDSSGFYLFSNIYPARYSIVIQRLLDYKLTAFNVVPGGTDVSKFFDQDSIYRTFTFQNFDGDNRRNIDAGLQFRNGNVNGLVWSDDNGDGIYDTNENPLSDIVVVLFDCNQNPLDTVTTDDNGAYVFDVQAGSDFYILAELPDNYSYSISGLESDVDGSNGLGTTACAFLSPNGAINFSVGLAPLAEVGDFVWFDENENGIQDLIELGVSGININLLDDQSNVLNSQLTDSLGFYLFEDLYPGVYTVQIDLSGLEYTITLQNEGNDDQLDSDFEANSTALFSTEVVVMGIANFDIDAGLIPSAQVLNGLVWNDGNGDGEIGTDEDLLSDIQVNVIDCQTNEVQNTMTINGSFDFNVVANHEYYFEVVYDDNIYEPSRDGSDSVIDDSNGPNTSACFTAEDIEQQLISIGLAPLSAIGDFVWLDLDKDGIQSDVDLGLEGIEVLLYNQNGQLTNAVETDADGAYLFSTLYPGAYQIVVTIPTDDLIPTLSFQGTNDQLDSNFELDANDDLSTTIVIGDGIDRLDLDAGLQLNNFIISGTVWNDGNGDGIFDSTEGIVSGITVNFINCNDGTLVSTNTDMGGVFEADILNDQFIYLEFVFDENQYEASRTWNPSIINHENGMNTSSCYTAKELSEKDVFAGLAPLSSIGDYVWGDTNEDGIQDDNELGIEFVDIQLIDENNNVVSSSVSNASGNYIFNAVYPGNYYLQIESNPNAFLLSPFGIGDAGLNSDFEEINGFSRTNIFAVENGLDLLDLDAGFYEETITYSISGLAFEDNNANGVRDQNDELISNINVSLYNTQDNLVLETQTDANGRYVFQLITEGDYYVVFEIPEGAHYTDPNIGNEDNDSDVDSNIRLGSTLLFTLEGNDFENLDGGFYFNGNIGDYVWNDANEDGMQDSDENGIEGIELELWANSNLVSTTTTDANGVYNFEVRPGSYDIRIALPDDMVFSMANMGGNDNLDSDFISMSGVIAEVNDIEISSAEVVLNIDAGFYEEEIIIESNIIQGYVWEDMDGNGLLTNEMGTDDVRVVLINDNGILVDSQDSYTDSSLGSGYYAFKDVPEGNYYLEFQLRNQEIPTEAEIGQDDSSNSSVTQENGPFTTSMFSVTSTSGVIHRNAGYFRPASIGDFVWNDSNGNGIQDLGEDGVNDILIRLFDTNNNQIGQTVTRNHPSTGTAGYYQFSNLTPDTYFVLVNLQSGMFTTDAFQGSNDDFDSNVDNSNGVNTTNDLNLSSGETMFNVDIGVLQTPGNIGSKLWLDTDGDGVQDDNESGMNGVQVNLYNEFSKLESSTTTVFNINEGDGYYIFENIQPGNYYVQFELPNGYFSTVPDRGGNDTKDSDITNVIEDGATNIFNLDPGESNMDLDGGIYLPARVGDYVWVDDNENGIQDSNESGQANIAVRLTKLDEELEMNTVTDNNGNYVFDGLRPGSYILSFEPENGFAFTQGQQGSNEERDSDADLTGTTSVFTVDYNEDLMNMDAGLIVANNRIGDYVWFDENGNGLQDFSERGLEGVTVNLLNSNFSLLQSTRTNLLGTYAFSDFAQGNYYIQFVAPNGYEFSPKGIGFDQSTDSDVNANGRTDLINVTAGMFENHFDAALRLEGNFAPLENNGLHLNATHKESYNEITWKDFILDINCNYELYRKTPDGSVEQLARMAIYENESQYQFEDRDIKRGGYYSYELIKKNRENKRVDSETVEVFVPHYVFDHVDIAPNITSDGFRIINADIEKNPQHIQIKVINQNGITLLNKEVSIEEWIDITELPEGLYNIIVESEIQTDIKRLIKQ